MRDLGCPEVELGIRYGLFYFRIILIIVIIIFVVVAAAAVSVVIWRYPIGWSLSIWNARMMQFRIFLGRTLGQLARGARRRLFHLQLSNCNFDLKSRWVNSREEFQESSSFLICL